MYTISIFSNLIITLALVVILTGISLAVLYFIIKAAVKNGTIEAYEAMRQRGTYNGNIPPAPPSPPAMSPPSNTGYNVQNK